MGLRMLRMGKERWNARSDLAGKITKRTQAARPGGERTRPGCTGSPRIARAAPLGKFRSLKQLSPSWLKILLEISDCSDNLVVTAPGILCTRYTNWLLHASQLLWTHHPPS
jgi:hypothetical protein